MLINFGYCNPAGIPGDNKYLQVARSFIDLYNYNFMSYPDTLQTVYSPRAQITVNDRVYRSFKQLSNQLLYNGVDTVYRTYSKGMVQPVATDSILISTFGVLTVNGLNHAHFHESFILKYSPVTRSFFVTNHLLETH